MLQFGSRAEWRARENFFGARVRGRASGTGLIACNQVNNRYAETKRPVLDSSRRVQDASLKKSAKFAKDFFRPISRDRLRRERRTSPMLAGRALDARRNWGMY